MEVKKVREEKAEKLEKAEEVKKLDEEIKKAEDKIYYILKNIFKYILAFNNESC